MQSIDHVGIIYIDLPSDLNITGAEVSGSIKVQGKQLMLESTSTDDFSLIADCSRIREPGEYDIDLKPIVPAGIAVLRYRITSYNVCYTKLLRA